MRRLLVSDDPDFMAKVYQYLRQHRMPVSVNEQGDKLELWLHQNAYEAAARQLITDYKNNPERLQATAPGSPGSQSGSLRRNFLHSSGWLTRSIAALAVLVYLALQMAPEAVLSALRISHVYNTLPFTQPWRFVTPVLLHFSLMHLVFNVFWWWYLGGRIERSLGSSWLLAVLFFSGVSANVLQYLFSGPNFGGLSGVVYGLLGFCWLYSWGRKTPLWLPPGLIVFMVGWLILGYTDVLWVNIANEAHLTGLLSGCLAGFIVRLLNPRLHRH
ncbi:rhomboid family intramembrane serine protease [Idiomarina seosinensis]|uniref:rhomboid family intramembrane serine protease n=1 Tax=Idiomarina seosinensis TaxID=281739 RepID=UPI0038513215